MINFFYSFLALLPHRFCTSILLDSTSDETAHFINADTLAQITFCVLAARPTVPVANRTQEQLEPPVKTSADQQRVGRRRSRRKPNSTTTNK